MTGTCVAVSGWTSLATAPRNCRWPPVRCRKIKIPCALHRADENKRQKAQKVKAGRARAKMQRIGKPKLWQPRPKRPETAVPVQPTPLGRAVVH